MPPPGEPLQLLLVHPDSRDWRWEPGFRSVRGPWCCNSVQAPWVVLGWLPADGSLPRGEPDEVDPGVARLLFCAAPQLHTPAHDSEYPQHDDSGHRR